ncbi:MAG: hypothetical protein JW774_01720 [Candidatus Aureabacteria bacterium]|nr:hypothetical protein [Candidatus Auribacterota bacterium]
MDNSKPIQKRLNLPVFLLGKAGRIRGQSIFLILSGFISSLLIFFHTPAFADLCLFCLAPQEQTSREMAVFTSISKELNREGQVAFRSIQRPGEVDLIAAVKSSEPVYLHWGVSRFGKWEMPPEDIRPLDSIPNQKGTSLQTRMQSLSGDIRFVKITVPEHVDCSEIAFVFYYPERAKEQQWVKDGDKDYYLADIHTFPELISCNEQTRTLEFNKHELKKWIIGLIERGLLPMLFFDFDDTLNLGYGGYMPDESIGALDQLVNAGGIIAIHSGIDLLWGSQKILRLTQSRFPFHFLVLSTGKDIFAWSHQHKAYLKLPFSGDNKSDALMKLASFLGILPHQMGYCCDFPGSGDKQDGIDDPTLSSNIGFIANVSPFGRMMKLPAESSTRLIQPDDNPLTRQAKGACNYMAAASDVLRQYGQTPNQAISDINTKLLAAGFKLPVLEPRVDQYTVWTKDNQVSAIPEGHVLRVETDKPGMVYAGKEGISGWERTYAIPLRLESGKWIADILDPEVNTFTFIENDPLDEKKVGWLGKKGANYYFSRYAVPSGTSHGSQASFSA